MSPFGISNKLPGCIWYGFCHAVCSSRQIHILWNEVILHSCPCNKTPILMSQLSSSFTICCTCLTSLYHEMFQYYWIGCLVQSISNGKFFIQRNIEKCSTAPNHCLNQYWLFLNLHLRNIFQWNYIQNWKFFIHANAFGNFVCNFV